MMLNTQNHLAQTPMSPKEGHPDIRGTEGSRLRGLHGVWCTPPTPQKPLLLYDQGFYFGLKGGLVVSSGEECGGPEAAPPALPPVTPDCPAPPQGS